MISVNSVLKNPGKTAAPVVLGVLIGRQGLADGFFYLGVGGAVVSGLILVAFVYDSTGQRARIPQR